MKYRMLTTGDTWLPSDEQNLSAPVGVWRRNDSWGALVTGKVSAAWLGKARRPITLGKRQKRTANNRMAAALWRELKRRQGNGRIPLRIDWIAVTEERLNAACAALRHT